MRFTCTMLLALVAVLTYAQSNKELSALVNKCKTHQAYPDSLLKYGEQMLLLNEPLAHYEGNFAIGLGMYRKGAFTSAAQYYQLALRHAVNQNLDVKQFQARRNLAITLRQLGQLNKALVHLDTLERNAFNNNDSSAISSTLNTKGALQKQVGNLKEASKTYQQAFAYTHPKSYSQRANIALNLGVLYGGKQQQNLANKWFREALQFAKQTNNEIITARALNNLGYSKSVDNQLDSSVYFYQQTLRIYKKQKNPRELLLGYRNLAEVYLKQKDYKGSQQYLDSATQQLSQDDLVSRGLLLSAQAELFYQQEQYNAALTYADSALYFNQLNNEAERIIYNYRLQSKLYEALNQPSTALEFERKAKNLSDSISTYNDMQVIQASANSVDLLKKTEEAEQLKQEQSFWRSSLFIAALVGIALVLIILFVVFDNRRRKNLITSKNKEIEALSTKMEAVKQDEFSNATILLKSKAIIALPKLMYVETDGHYLNLYLEDGKETDRNSLKELLEQLPEKYFVQIHRSFVVNVNYIRAVYSTKILLKTGVELSVSRTFKDSLKAHWVKKTSISGT